MTTPTIDPLDPPTWRVVNQMLDELLPADSHRSERFELGEAISQLVHEAQTIAVKRHGQIISAAISGGTWDLMSELLEQWPNES